MNRREFLKLSALLPAISYSPTIFANINQKIAQPPILVLVELKGGNDGLNTLIPIDDPLYRSLRPKIAIPRSNALMLDEGFAMHSALEPLLPLWKSGDMAWVHGLGYPNPNRSHFRSIEIWETGGEVDDYDLQGWISKLYPESSGQLKAVVVGSDAGPLVGSAFDKIVMENVKTFRALTKHLRKVRAETSNPALAHALDVQNNVLQNAQTLIDTLKKPHISTVNFPKHQFGKRLNQVSQMINSGLGASVYKVELGGFDTHRGQLNIHQQLLNQLSSGLGSFAESVQEAGHWDNVLIMTYSEFGRRAGENRSGGSDHGTASAHFLLGGRVRGGLHGQAPSLDNLVKNDLVHTTDFRSLYHTIATQWLGTLSPWSEYPSLKLIDS